MKGFSVRLRTICAAMANGESILPSGNFINIDPQCWPTSTDSSPQRLVAIDRRSIHQLSNALVPFFPYPISDTTSFTSGIMRLSMPSIPALSVTVEEGQPLQEPCKITVTMPSSKDLNSILPPSISTAGFT